MSVFVAEAFQSAGEGAAAEAELLLAAYGDAVRVVSSGDQRSLLSGVVTCTVLVVSLGVLGTTVCLSIPHDFPKSRIDFRVDGDQLTAAERRLLQRELLDWEAGEVGSGGDFGEVGDEVDDRDAPKALESFDDRSTEVLFASLGFPGSLEICQRVLDGAREAEQSRLSRNGHRNTGDASASLVLLPRFVVLARMLIYFHHIVSPAKRRCIAEWANSLGLGGFSRPGYPGLVLVEGAREAVVEYVATVQRLRWKHMVVRGEELEEIELSPHCLSVGSRGSSESKHGSGSAEAVAPMLSRDAEILVAAAIDSRRRLPQHFLGEVSSMAEAGSLCAAAGLRDLFLTAMKKF